MATKAATLSPELSKQARRELGLSQNDVIKASGIQAYKLKQWEGRGLTIELADIRKLTDFYESQGISIADLIQHHAGKHGGEHEGSARGAPGAASWLHLHPAPWVRHQRPTTARSRRRTHGAHGVQR
jgi:transcriptional regulator with XRE-family HTH domain